MNSIVLLQNKLNYLKLRSNTKFEPAIFSFLPTYLLTSHPNHYAINY